MSSSAWKLETLVLRHPSYRPGFPSLLYRCNPPGGTNLAGGSSKDIAREALKIRGV